MRRCYTGVRHCNCDQEPVLTFLSIFNLVLPRMFLRGLFLVAGVPSPFPNPCLGPVDTSEASYVLFNNMYNTNCALSPLSSSSQLSA